MRAVARKTRDNQQAEVLVEIPHTRRSFQAVGVPTPVRHLGARFGVAGAPPALSFSGLFLWEMAS
jgi:hypothetical protein